MIKSKEIVKRLMADGWVLSRGCSGGYLLVHLDELKHRHVLPRVAKDLEAAGEIVRCDDRTTRVGARWRLPIQASACDCQNPPPCDGAEGIWHVSEDCPIHGPIPWFTPFTATPAALEFQS